MIAPPEVLFFKVEHRSIAANFSDRRPILKFKFALRAVNPSRVSYECTIILLLSRDGYFGDESPGGVPPGSMEDGILLLLVLYFTGF